MHPSPGFEKKGDPIFNWWCMNQEAALSKRSRLVDAANRALPALYGAHLLQRPVLDGDAICAQVQAETGLNEFGDEWFRQPLGNLIKALCGEAALNRLGEFVAVGQLKKVLKDRLHAEHWFSTRPEISQRGLHSPVIVVGPMRSGTTRLHRLLASDDRFAHMRFFETVNPVPAPGFNPGHRDRRPIPAKLALAAVHRLNPVTESIHPTGLYQPEEELGLLVRSIWGMKHEAQWHVPSFGRWCEKQDATPAYRDMAQLLRLVGWARGEDDTRPWVLKTPQHMLDLPALLQVFPDARIIFTHREPQAVVGSSCSLVWNQMIIHSDSVDAREIGSEWLRKTEVQIERMRSARVQIPESQRIDVHYADMDQDWLGVMRRVYGFLGMDIDPALASMTSYIEDSEQERHRHPHRYTLSAFGLDADDVADRFQSYTDAFDLNPQPITVPPEETPILFPEPAIRQPVPGIGKWTPAKTASAAAGRR